VAAGAALFDSDVDELTEAEESLLAEPLVEAAELVLLALDELSDFAVSGFVSVASPAPLFELVLFL
jgi:hypothetical protein